MKVVHWIILVLLALLGYTTYTAFVTTQNVKLDMPEITLKANGTQNTLEPQNSFKCPQNAKKGCIQFDLSTLGPIKFTIQNGKKDETCSASPKPQWVITLIELTADEIPGTGKGDYTSRPIPDWLSNAFPQLNTQSGVVYQADVSFATSSAVIIDLNNHNNTDGVKTLYYKVTAKNCSDTKTLVTDPSITNYGK
jgi:hypothetical protein